MRMVNRISKQKFVKLLERMVYGGCRLRLAWQFMMLTVQGRILVRLEGDIDLSV